MSPQVQVNDFTLKVDLHNSKSGGGDRPGEKLSPFNQLSKYCQISQHSIWQNKYIEKNFIYIMPHYNG